MASFSELYSSFDADPDRRGKQFERFVKWFLINDPEWSSQVAQVWLWEEYPGRWGRDCGIDLVFKHKNGQTWAVQAKCYSPSYEITKSDVDKFLSETNRKGIDHRLLIATTDRLGANAKQVIEAQEKPVVRYLRIQFDNAAVDYPYDISSLAHGKRKAPHNPHKYQLDAIEDVVSGFKTAERGQLIMACGTGKTFVSLWIKERLDAKRTLVVVPSLGLLSQILNEWTAEARVPFDVLCVCSDQTAGRRDEREDEVISSVSDLAFPVTDPDPEIARREIARFLKGDGHRVIFSTYQSSPLVADAQRDRNVPSFDLLVADEAHRCAGKVDSAFATVLDGTKLRSTRRLFATATPRTYRRSLKKKAEEIGVEVVDMNDEAAFGKPLHVLTFGEAIRRGWLTDYRVVIVGVDDETIAEWIRNRRIVATDAGIETDAQSLAAEIGLIKAIKDWDLQRIITFHNRVKRAKRFSQELKEVSQWLGYEHRPLKTIWCEHVSGDMPTITRRQKLQRLKAVGDGEVGLLSNARCLSEGVDVPALDGVAFIDARSSEIDIVQAVGRAIRLSAKKQMGTIVIPVFIERHDDPEGAITSSNFKPIWDVLDALKAHDDVLSEQLDQLRIELGSGKKSNVGEHDLSKIVLDLPATVGNSFAESLRAHMVVKTTEAWLFWYGLLQAFVNEQGHCRVSRDFVTADGHRLGQWCSNQRAKENTLSVERKTRLDALGFVWDPHTVQWEQGFQELLTFWNENGHCRVPPMHVTANGYRLRQWVQVQRKERDKLTAERRARLDALGFVWDLLTTQWEKGLRHLEAYFSEHGHCRVPVTHVTADRFPLGTWVAKQRQTQNTLSDGRRARLDALGFVWDPLTSQWEEGCQHLQAYFNEHGHCQVLPTHVTTDGYRLGQWVQIQRIRESNISPERRTRLDALGFVWDPLEGKWEEGIEHLQSYVTEHGHCRVPFRHIAADGYGLGRWVNKQRQLRAKMSADRKARLNALGFVWHRHQLQWEEGFEHLQAYVKEHGDCGIPDTYVAADGYRLGQWVRVQRRNEAGISAERRSRLDALGFVWDARADQWEVAFQHLAAFVDEHGHCRVPISHIAADGYRLGQWIKIQRRQKEKGFIPAERQARLDALGFVWDPLTAQWEEGFQQLRAFVDEHGHCRVPRSLVGANEYPLGQWVQVQRRQRDSISPERKARLDGLGFIWPVKNDGSAPERVTLSSADS